ncbi:hypothetical protein IV102_32010 [bacterium]|nr:hypothetical protein [bacterium]
MWPGKIAIVWAVLFATAGADPRSDIAAAYGRSSRAMALKYVDGILSIRAPGYQLFDTDGVMRDNSVERSRLAFFLGSGLRVEEDTQILTFQQEGTVARAKVRYQTRLLQKERWLHLETVCQDEWALLGGRWLLRRTKMVSQDAANKPL